MLNEFKTFIARGNVVDLAVGIIIGAAFTAIVNSLVADLINPIIGLGTFLAQVFLRKPLMVAPQMPVLDLLLQMRQQVQSQQ